MKDYDATETAYKNGFAEGITALANLIRRRLNCNTPRGAYLIGIVDTTVKELMEVSEK